MKSKADQPDWKTIFSDPYHFLAFGFGSGLSPWAPGTVGSLIALPFFYFLHELQVWNYLGVVIILFIGGIFLCDISANKLGIHDHKGIVWDEIVGLLLTLWLVPRDWLWIGLGFVLFRFFDIVKPWPCCQVDQCMRNGLGIMLDDAIAAIYSLLIIQILIITFNG